MCLGEMAVLAQRGLQAFPDLGSLPWLQANLLWALSGGKNGCLEIEPTMRQGTQGVGKLQVNEVFGSLNRNKFRFSQRAPSIRLGAEVFDFGDRARPAEKRRGVLRHVQSG